MAILNSLSFVLSLQTTSMLSLPEQLVVMLRILHEIFSYEHRITGLDHKGSE